MTTIAYAAVIQSGFLRQQLWMRPEIIPWIEINPMRFQEEALRRLSSWDIVKICRTKYLVGQYPHRSSVFNLICPPASKRTLRMEELPQDGQKVYGQSAQLGAWRPIDAVRHTCAYGYLISQLSCHPHQSS